MLAKRGQWHDDFLSLDVSKGLLGVCAVFIVLHHLSQALGEQAGWLAEFENMGVCFVGFFFFFSGYGLLKSYLGKENYLKGFFRKRFPTILIPFYLIIILFLVVEFALGTKMTGAEFISYLSGWKLINTHMWYIVEIAILYLLFYLIFQFCRKTWLGVTIMGIIVAAGTVWSLRLNHGDYWFQGEWWYNTSFLFVIGMIVAHHEEAIVQVIKKIYLILLALFAAGFVGLYQKTAEALENKSYWSEFDYANPAMAYGDKFYCLKFQLPMVIAFVLLILLISMKFQLKNRMMDALGAISLELYLIHNIFILPYQNGTIRMASPIFYVLAVVSASILLAIILHYMDQIIIRRVVKK